MSFILCWVSFKIFLRLSLKGVNEIDFHIFVHLQWCEKKKNVLFTDLGLLVDPVWTGCDTGSIFKLRWILSIKEDSYDSDREYFLMAVLVMVWWYNDKRLALFFFEKKKVVFGLLFFSYNFISV